MPDIYDERGRLLVSSAQLRRAMRTAPRRRTLPDWMHQLRWPAGMIPRMRAAHAEGELHVLRILIEEGRILLQAEQKGLPAAAAAIRHQLNLKYGAD